MSICSYNIFNVFIIPNYSDILMVMREFTKLVIGKLSIKEIVNFRQSCWDAVICFNGNIFDIEFNCLKRLFGGVE